MVCAGKGADGSVIRHKANPRRDGVCVYLLCVYPKGGDSHIPKSRVNIQQKSCFSKRFCKITHFGTQLACNGT